MRHLRVGIVCIYFGPLMVLVGVKSLLSINKKWSTSFNYFWMILCRQKLRVMVVTMYSMYLVTRLI